MCATTTVHLYLFLQIEISHKNQVPMLVGPPPKSRSLFSFLTRELRKTDENFDDDQEWVSPSFRIPPPLRKSPLRKSPLRKSPPTVNFLCQKENSHFVNFLDSTRLAWLAWPIKDCVKFFFNDPAYFASRTWKFRSLCSNQKMFFKILHWAR